MILLYASLVSVGLAFLLAPVLIQFVTLFQSITGAHRYYSRYLYVSGNSVHLGTSFDILWKMRRASRREAYREILAGLRRFCETAAPNARVSVCTWFLSPRKMRRLGFQQERATPDEKLELAGGYLEILFQQWLLTRRLRFFNPFTVPRYTIPVAALRRNFPAAL